MPEIRWYASSSEEYKRRMARLHQILWGYKVRTYPQPKNPAVKRIGNKYYYVYKGILGMPKENGGVQPLPTVEYLAKHDGIVRIASEELARRTREELRRLGIRFEERSGG